MVCSKLQARDASERGSYPPAHDPVACHKLTRTRGGFMACLSPKCIVVAYHSLWQHAFHMPQNSATSAVLFSDMTAC